MKIKRFEEIEAWKEARKLVKNIYNDFKNVRVYSSRNQIQRAAISVMSNISEGFDRGSNKEFIQYLIISRGSFSELKSQSYAALDIGYIDTHAFDRISEQCLKVANLLNGFIRFLRTTPREK